MESSPYVDPTLEALSGQPREDRDGVGLAMQAYLYRTAKDLEDLIPLGPAVRIVKGAYLEPPDVAYPEEVGRGRELLHAVPAADGAGRAEAGKPGAHRDARCRARRSPHPIHRREKGPVLGVRVRDAFGIQRGQQQRLAASGRRLRVLISYGEYWFPWYMRRLAERPANVGFVPEEHDRRMTED